MIKRSFIRSEINWLADMVFQRLLNLCNQDA